MNVGLRPVALVSIWHTLPQSGTAPYQVGHTQSGLVASHVTPRFSRIQLSSSFWNVSSRSKPLSRMSTSSSTRVVTGMPALSSCCRNDCVPAA